MLQHIFIGWCVIVVIVYTVILPKDIVVMICIVYRTTGFKHDEPLSHSTFASRDTTGKAVHAFNAAHQRTVSVRLISCYADPQHVSSCADNHS